MHTHPPNRRRERGSSFAELMIASLVIGTTLVATTSSMSKSAEVYHFFADGPHEALMLAQEVHEAAMLLPWESQPGMEAGFGEDVYTLWDLDETAYHPPRSAEYVKVKSHITWKQEVEVRHVDLNDPTVVIDPDEFEGDTLIELRVKVTELSGVQTDPDDPEPDTITDFGWYSWWMSEPTVEEDAG